MAIDPDLIPAQLREAFVEDEAGPRLLFDAVLIEILSVDGGDDCLLPPTVTIRPSLTFKGVEVHGFSTKVLQQADTVGLTGLSGSTPIKLTST